MQISPPRPTGPGCEGRLHPPKLGTMIANRKTQTPQFPVGGEKLTLARDRSWDGQKSP